MVEKQYFYICNLNTLDKDFVIYTDTSLRG